jgi:acyl carrier protein
MPGSAAQRDHIQDVVHSEIRRILDALGTPIARICADDSLSEALGLTSVDLVELIVALNARLHLDPFRQRAFTELQTVGDLVAAYAGHHAHPDPAAGLAVSRRRAAARREHWRMP